MHWTATQVRLAENVLMNGPDWWNIGGMTRNPQDCFQCSEEEVG